MRLVRDSEGVCRQPVNATNHKLIMKTAASKLIWVALGAVLAVLVMAAANYLPSEFEQPVPTMWSHVQAVEWGDGGIAFFDTTDGRVYFYGAANNLLRCDGERQLVQLGAPMRRLRD